jgi:hypothetical protein
MRPTLRKVLVVLAFALSFAVMHQESVSAIICPPNRPFECVCPGQANRCVASPSQCICP